MPLKFQTFIFCSMFLVSGVSASHALDLDEIFSSTNGSNRLYVQGNITGAWMEMETDGFNTAGGFPNTGDGETARVGYGGALGLMSQKDSFRVRYELEGMWRPDANYITDSFPGPPGPPAFFYRTNVDKNWSLLGNIWLDVPVGENVMLYGGGGLGLAALQVRTTDFVVAGIGDDTNFAFQLGTGLIFSLTENLELDFGYRYYDLGKTQISLNSGATGGFVADLDSHELMVSLRLFLR